MGCWQQPVGCKGYASCVRRSAYGRRDSIVAAGGVVTGDRARPRPSAPRLSGRGPRSPALHVTVPPRARPLGRRDGGSVIRRCVARGGPIFRRSNLHVERRSSGRGRARACIRRATDCYGGTNLLLLFLSTNGVKRAFWGATVGFSWPYMYSLHCLARVARYSGRPYADKSRAS